VPHALASVAELVDQQLARTEGLPDDEIFEISVAHLLSAPAWVSLCAGQICGLRNDSVWIFVLKVVTEEM
jgi:hypothetical protein